MIIVLYANWNDPQETLCTILYHEALSTELHLFSHSLQKFVSI